jgi:hypothetical protein
MKKAIISTFVTTIFFANTAFANWVIINEDGTTEPLNCKCSIKRSAPKVIKKWKPTKKRGCAPSRPCNTEALPSAKLFPIKPNEKLEPAVLKNCQYDK